MCYVTNIAAHYRSAIYQLMDKTFDIDFIFGDHPADKRFDVTLLNNPTRVFQNTYLTKSIYYQKGIPFLYRRYDKILITGDPHCLSTWFLLLFSRIFGRKQVYLWSHGWYGKESKFETVIKKWFFSISDGVFVYGDRAKSLMVKVGLDGNKIWPIHNCLDYEKQLEVRSRLTHTNVYNAKFHNDRPNLIFIGRLTPQKKLDMIIDALKICRGKGYFFNMTFIGEGVSKTLLEEKVNSCGLKNQVWFYGACHDENVNGELIYNSDLCVSPGNVGLTAVHCMTFGTPVLTNNDFNHQMPEFETIVPGKTGNFFEAGNSESLSQAIIDWFETKKDREVIRQNCYENIEKGWTPEYQIGVLKKNMI